MTEFRRAWLCLHRWLGLTAGLVVALLGVTGSFLVFYPAIDLQIHPQKRPSTELIKPVRWTPNQVQAQLRELHPERPGPWRIEVPMDPSQPIRLRYYKPAERLHHHFAPLLLTMDPHTLEVTSQGFWGDDVTTWIYDLHYALLSGKMGMTLVGLLGLSLAVSLLSGLRIWWPSLRNWRLAVSPRIRESSVRKVYDIHRIGGAYGWVVLLVLALTGTALALPEQTSELVPVRARHPPTSEQLAMFKLSDVGDLNAAVDAAKRMFPGAEVRWIETAGDGAANLSVRMHSPQEPSRRFPKTQVWWSTTTGEVTAANDPDRFTWRDVFHQWLHPLHNGEALGLAGRWLVAAAGLLPLVLYLTGLLRWWQKRTARNKSAMKRPAA